MGLFHFLRKRVTVDPADLTIPDLVETSSPGVTLVKVQPGRWQRLDIVGESFRQDNVRAVAEAAAGQRFDFYLVPEQGNPHDKNAVGVWVGNLQVGYVPASEAKEWRKIHAAFLKRGEILWGTAQASSRDGSMFGIFGDIGLPALAASADPTAYVAAALTPAQLQKAVDKLWQLGDSDEPDTVSQVKALAKRATKPAQAIAGHAEAAQLQDPARETEWMDLADACGSLLEAIAEAQTVMSADDLDLISDLMMVCDALEVLQLTSSDSTDSA